MPHRHKIDSKEIGQVRIYMAPNERRKAKNFKDRLKIKPLFQEIINAAKADGILNATAHHTHYGYSGNGPVIANITEVSDQLLNLCVELIGPRDQLEVFCRHHGELLKGKVIVYKHMEHWELNHNDIEVTEADELELDADVIDDEIPAL